MTINLSIPPASTALKQALQDKIDQKTKPLGALGRLETLALEIGLIQNTTEPKITKPSLVVFAGDHGIVKSGVSSFPQEVTQQMVLNFLGDGAAINVFAKQTGIALYVVDAGVKGDFPNHPRLIKKKMARGTRNMLEGPAMQTEECLQAMNTGGEIVKNLYQQGCNTIGYGEMGIGNTSAAALLMSHFCALPLANCVGSGTGLDAEGINRKLMVLKQVQERHKDQVYTPIEALASYGGYEIAMICGAFIEAAALGMVILVDGFIASAALLPAFALHPNILDYCLFSHLSREHGHRKMLEFFGKEPILQLDLRLGEGTGAALALPMVQAAVNFLNEMASFESAGVSRKG